MYLLIGLVVGCGVVAEFGLVSRPISSHSILFNVSMILLIDRSLARAIEILTPDGHHPQRNFEIQRY